MTINEAITLQKELLNRLPEGEYYKYMASTKLGIEALRRIKMCRQSQSVWELPDGTSVLSPLKGETRI